ncbi:helix-turn-helix transcriptional regulator [Amycolatopsis sp. SID8362]|uniref:helix-turn-helix transcriptional regulator n=1 Tax=Amycolatopsis sp. SID8362 TaxID=2690346 RepID=UPI00136FBA05|nr:helix-turn-helix transcriptional regulator [Amycolatopsis sp. SID8362]NBH05376.1 helix-turn-helix domain-containing protein [Amycolatopsis sp. SID8362]NED42076.1 helix-turn-helix domain-containing protein [Amycolatopsis sp. SID8362]
MTQTQVHANRREELGQFLKACRARIGPAEVGLAPGPRRRLSGLRREEVALLAGVGVTWYTWLEQGRPINASSQVLDAVARTLRLDHPEREHLYRLAELTPSRLPSPAEVVPDAVREVLRALDPLPATIVNGRFDVLESNAAHEEMFFEWHSMPCLHKNLLWCCVTEPNARRLLLNYDEEVPHMVARMRAEYGRHVGDPIWEEDIRRLSALSPEFVELWARHEVAEPRARLRRMDHPRAGRLNLRLTELAVSEAPGLRIQVSTPDDAATWALLPSTRLSS